MAEVVTDKKIVYPGNGNRNGLSENYSLIFRVFSDNRLADDHLAVMEFDSIPKTGTPYFFTGKTRYNLRARTFSAKFVSTWGKNGAIWDVEVGYDNSNKGDDPPDPSEADPFTISPRMERIELPMEIDLDGVPVRNSAGQKYDEPPMHELYYPVYSIGRTEYSNPCNRQLDFMNRVNSFPFWGFPPGMVCMKNIEPSTSVSWGTPSWQVQYEIAINIYFELIDLWQLEILDAGTNEIFTDSENDSVAIRAILDTQGKEITQPVPLDGSGRKLPDDGDPVWHWYRKRFAADFNLLKIPNPFLV